jgi:hypothetical protein
MPIRTYECPNGHVFERINCPLKLKCPTCGKKAKAAEWEIPGKRNPKHGMQMEM